MMRVKFASIGALALLAGCSSADEEPTAQTAEAGGTANSQSAPPAAPSQGKLLFLQCAACHALDADAPAKVGPHLACVLDKPAGSVEGFNYSQAFQTAAADGLVWDRETLLAFVIDPKGLVPGNAMAFGGVADGERAMQIVDYLEQECASDAG